MDTYPETFEMDTYPKTFENGYLTGDFLKTESKVEAFQNGNFSFPCERTNGDFARRYHGETCRLSSSELIHTHLPTA